MSLSANFPTIRPSLLLDFANTQTLDPRITFTRSTTATYYDGVTTAKAEQNLLTYSQEFDNAVWAKYSSTVTVNSTTAPDGTTTADTFAASATVNAHYVAQTYATTAGAAYTMSVYAKASATSFIQIAGSTSAFDSQSYANFNLSSGTVGTVGTSATASITSVGSGWYRCTVTATATATQSSGTVIGVFAAILSATDARIPSIDGTGISFYLWGAQVEQRSSVTAYTATTSQPITNYIPVLQTAAAGVARFDHNPTTGESLGLLIEEQRTNLLTYSEQFDNAAWSKSNATVTANAVVAPDGTLTADALQANSGTFTSAPYIRNDVANTDPRTLSIYAKAGSYNFIKINPRSFGGVGGIVVDLTTGQITSTATTTPPTGTSVVSVGNGWWRISLSTTSTGTVQTLRLALSQTATTDADGGTFTGNEFVYIWGAQLEAGAFPTSYIKTEASQVTRSADAASMTGTNFSSWYRADEGTVYVDALTVRPLSDTGTSVAFSINDGTTNNRIQSNFDIDGHLVVGVSGTAQVNIDLGSVTPNLFNKLAAVYKVNDFAVSLNGATAVTDTSGTIPVVTQLLFGQRNNDLYLNGHIKKIVYYPRRLSNTEIVAITS